MAEEVSLEGCKNIMEEINKEGRLRMFEEEIKVLKEAQPSARYLVGTIVTAFLFALVAGVHNDSLTMLFAILTMVCILKFVIYMIKGE